MRKNLLQFFALLLLPVFFYTTTVKEIHFLFLHHADEHRDECHNHLHESHEHEPCTFCKIDLPAFENEPTFSPYACLHFSLSPFIFFHIAPFTASLLISYSLRGPPVV